MHLIKHISVRISYDEEEVNFEIPKVHKTFTVTKCKIYFMIVMIDCCTQNEFITILNFFCKRYK